MLSWLQGLTSARTVNVCSLIVLVVSGIINISLFGVLLARSFRFWDASGCPHQSLVSAAQAESQRSAPELQSDPTAYLSHVVVALHESGAELRTLDRTFAYWRRYPPCVHNSYPTNWSEAHVQLTFYIDTAPSDLFARTLVDMYNELPRSVRSCFASMEVRQGGVEPPQYAAVPGGNVTFTSDELLRFANAERDCFANLLTNKIELVDPSHILLLTSDSFPIQSNWLNLMDYETRVPVERFWIKGSLFRGPTDRRFSDQRDLMAFSRTALYNLKDASFPAFYTDVVRPFVAADGLALKKPFEYDWTHCLFQMEHYNWTRIVANMFRPTDAIQDYSECEVDVARLQTDSPDTLIVKGRAPDLAVFSQ